MSERLSAELEQSIRRTNERLYSESNDNTKHPYLTEWHVTLLLAELDATREEAKRVIDAALEYRRLVRAEDSMCPSLVELSAGDELDAAIRAAIAAKGGGDAE